VNVEESETQKPILFLGKGKKVAEKDEEAFIKNFMEKTGGHIFAPLPTLSVSLNFGNVTNLVFERCQGTGTVPRDPVSERTLYKLSSRESFHFMLNLITNI